MTCIDNSDNLLPFLFMGCWNRDTATNSHSPRVAVTDAIRANPIKTLVLGGDNVYPKKVKVGNEYTKVYDKKTLMNGVHMLRGKNIYTALGNHNVSMLNTQLSLTEWTLPSRYYCIRFKDCALVVIDTNLIGTTDYDTMRSWLSEQVANLRKTRKQYYYVQHEPFISFKKHKKTVLPHMDELLGILASYPPIAILCADTHNFQQGVLQISNVKIPQIIVGTGGAEPDFVTAKLGDSYEVDDIKYTMDTYIPGYGYLQVTPDDTKFIKVMDWRSFEGVGGANGCANCTDNTNRNAYKRLHNKTRKKRHSQRVSKYKRHKKVLSIRHK